MDIQGKNSSNNKFENLFDFSKLKYVDPVIISVVFLLFNIGFVILYSAGRGNIDSFSIRQIERFLFFLPFFCLIICIDIKFIFKYIYLSYLMGIILLIYAEFAGNEVLGAKRWVTIVGVNIQPSEVMKIAIILTLAKYFHNIHIYNLNKIIHLMVPIIAIMIPTILILKQPDLGTTLILVSTGLAIMFCAGITMWFFGLSIAGIFLMLPIIWTSLKSYQQQRVLTFLNPDQDPLGSGYNIIQSKIAVGSGGLFGKGFLSGSQSQLSFLPESETDFIFTIISEEFGFIGAMIVILLFLTLFMRCLILCGRCKHQFGKLVILGISVFLFLHFFINIAMVIGLLPVVGAPLPFISYGGTMIIILMIAIALILNMDINKEKFIDSVEIKN